jgi:class I fructose-bisphosphate aldolase
MRFSTANGGTDAGHGGAGIDGAFLVYSASPIPGIDRHTLPAFEGIPPMAATSKTAELLGPDAESLLGYKPKGIPASRLHLPGPDFIDRVVSQSDRTPNVLRNYQHILDHGRLGGTGFVSILPVDQGIEHSAGASFAPNPDYFDPAKIVELAIEGGCNCVASTLGVLGMVSRRYAHKIPFMVKLNHNEILTYPNQFDQVMYGSVKQAFDMGAISIGATIYFGSPNATRQIQEVSAAFAKAHELGMVTVLWCYLRNDAFKVKGADGKSTDYHAAADLTGQGNHLGVTIEADIIKQKLPTNNGGYVALNMGGSSYGKFDKRIYTDLAGGDENGKGGHPIELCRYQLANCYMGRAPLINSGGESKGASDTADAVRTAVVNKRAGGMGLISGRKAFQRPLKEGVALLNTVQDVYLDKSVTVA